MPEDGGAPGRGAPGPSPSLASLAHALIAALAALDRHAQGRGVDLSRELVRLLGEVDERLAREAQARAERREKSVALIGTSANPITNAHLTLGLEILALTDVDEAWFYLAGEHPWGKKLLPAHHRVEMVRRAVARYPRLQVCDFEVRRGPEIYAVTRETAEIIRDFLEPAYPGHRFSFVMGSDVAQSFHHWRNAAWMAERLTIYVIHRLGYDFDKAGSLLADPRHVYFKDEVVTSNISSTLVRERGKGYDAAKLVALVPEVVWDYLREHRLLDPALLR